MTFIRADLPIRRYQDLECEELETICLELILDKRKWEILCSCRAPCMTDIKFEDEKSSALDKMLIYFKHIIALGDLNYDMLRKIKQSLL